MLLKRWCGRVLAIAAILMAVRSHAQKLHELDYVIRYAAPIDQTQEKYIHEALQAHEAGARVWVDAAAKEAKVRTHVPLERAALEAAWAPIGLEVVFLERWQVELPGSLRSQEASVPTGFPYFISTGDTVADEAHYQAAKAAWIAAHTKEYETIGPSTIPEQTPR